MGEKKEESKLNSRDKWRGVDLPGKLSPWIPGELGTRSLLAKARGTGQVQRGRRRASPENGFGR